MNLNLAVLIDGDNIPSDTAIRPSNESMETGQNLTSPNGKIYSSKMQSLPYSNMPTPLVRMQRTLP